MKAPAGGWKVIGDMVQAVAGANPQEDIRFLRAKLETAATEFAGVSAFAPRVSTPLFAPDDFGRSGAKSLAVTLAPKPGAAHFLRPTHP